MKREYPKSALSPEERRRLIERPITFRVLPRHPWAGTLINLPDLRSREERRTIGWVEDEEWGSIPATRKRYEED